MALGAPVTLEPPEQKVILATLVVQEKQELQDQMVIQVVQE